MGPHLNSPTLPPLQTANQLQQETIAHKTEVVRCPLAGEEEKDAKLRL